MVTGITIITREAESTKFESQNIEHFMACDLMVSTSTLFHVFEGTSWPTKSVLRKKCATSL